MEKKIDLSQTVFQLTQAYPELIEILAALGFSEIQKKAVRLSVGKLMTLPKGCAMKGIALDNVVKTLQDHGFEVVGDETPTAENSPKAQPETSTDEATQKIKSLLKRLNDGETLESVRADFVKDFSGVPATEIMKAEQELIGEGQAVKEVKNGALCNVAPTILKLMGIPQPPKMTAEPLI